MTDQNKQGFNESIEFTLNLPIKTELDPELNSKQLSDVMVQIKFEAENDTEELDANLQFKEETLMDCEKYTEESCVDNTPKHIDSAPSFDINNSAITKNEISVNDEIKVELNSEEDSLVAYDYPNFDDSISIDSHDAAVLGNVETCLQEDYIKSEEQTDFDDTDRAELNEHNIKKEAEVVTETHLISKKLINTTSTITNTQDGLRESQITKTLVMEILPVQRNALSKLSSPEEILPTPTSLKNDIEYDNMFQLNSITGNVLSLEQEAYGLLKAKKKVVKTHKIYHCDKCSKECKNLIGLRRHMEVHKSIERRAMGFAKGLKTRKENRKKRIKEEEEEFTSSCNRFKSDKTKQGEIKEKVKQESKTEGYECTCGSVFQRRSRMETCLRSHDLYSSTYSCHQCVTCLKQFKDKNDLLLHRKRFHGKKFQCKFCPTDYKTRKELFKHLQVHQKVQLMEYKVISEVVQGKQKLRCFMCSKSYSELSDLKSHVMEDHKSPYICPNCRMTFPKIIEFGNHVKTHHPEVEGQSVLNVLEAFSVLVKAWKCHECGLQFHEADKLALHQIEKHSPELKAEPQFQCTDCRRVFISQKGLTSHRRVHHSEYIEDTEPAEKGIMCVECRKICKDTEALTSHMRLHSPERKYPCKFCDFRFATPEKRKAHAEIHTGDMKYVCFICEYQCSSENRLSQHKMSLKHLNMKEFLVTGKPLIEEEQSTSKPKAKRKREDKKKEIEKEDNSSSNLSIPCDICGDNFVSEELMLEHKQTHPFIEFPNDDKPSRIFFK
ncbi:hypothetical protein ACJJTC_012924 [Scirpophaga incertulas]